MTATKPHESEASRSTAGSVLTVADTAVFLRISESLVRRLVRERRVPFFRIDGRYLFYRPRLERWMEELTIEPERSAALPPDIDQEGKIFS